MIYAAASSDPDWFFSTLSQSAAAVVGIIGGFFVSRLLQHLPAVRSSREAVILAFTQVRSTGIGLLRNLDSYCDWAEGLRPNVEKAIAEGSDHVVVTERRSMRGDSVRGPALDYHISAEWLSELDVASALRRKQWWLDLIQAGTVAVLPGVAQEFESLTGDDVPKELRGPFVDYQVQLKQLSRDVVAHEARAIPAGAWQLLGLLGFVGAVGIVVPLGFLSAGGGGRGDWKIILLVAFSLGLAGVGVLLTRLVDELRSSASLTVPERHRMVWPY